MSVLIKDMEIPKSCGKCILRYGYICIPNHEIICEVKSRLENCPLVEVDLDELDAAIEALKGIRDAYRIIAEAFCRPPETDIGSNPK